MALQEFTVESSTGYKGQSSTSWQTVTSGDSYRLYVGGSSYSYRAKIKFTTPDEDSVDGFSKVVYGLKHDETDNDMTPRQVRAFITKQSTSNANTTNITASEVIDVSYLYTDKDGTTRVATTGGVSGQPWCYFVFEGDFEKNTTYYIYVNMYTTDYGETATNIGSNAAAGWMRWRNTSSYSNISVYGGNAGYTVTYHTDGGDPDTWTEQVESGATIVLPDDTNISEPSGKSDSSDWQQFEITLSIHYPYLDQSQQDSFTAEVGTIIDNYISEWYVSSDSGLYDIDSALPGTEITVLDNLDIYATWSTKETEIRNKINDIPPPSLTYNGYKFIGWSLSVDRDELIPGDEDITEGMILYAVWVPISGSYACRSSSFSFTVPYAYINGAWTPLVSCNYSSTGWVPHI